MIIFGISQYTAEKTFGVYQPYTTLLIYDLFHDTESLLCCLILTHIIANIHAVHKYFNWHSVLVIIRLGQHGRLM
mgnify:CR=1 FL=1